MTTVKLPRTLLIENDLPSAAIEDRIVDHRRWTVVHEIIFELEGKFYRTTYERGGTEYQEQRPWEDYDQVDCEEVVQRDVVVKQWVSATT